MARLPALPYVRGYVTEGLSANAGYRRYRDEAQSQDLTGMRRQDFLRLYSQTRALRGQAEEAIVAPKDQLHGGLVPVERDTQRTRGFGYWVQVFQRTRGGDAFMSTPFLVKRSGASTPAEVEAQVAEWIADQENTYDRVTLGIGFVGVERFVPAQ